jgi:cell division protein FtsB
MIKDNKTKKKSAKQQKAEKPKKIKTASSSGSGFYYSFMTVILLLCLVQVTISAVLNISKIISYKAKIVQISKTRDAAVALNDQLKDNIKNFSNITGLEAIARNNLKMSGEDEVLVIINSNKDEEKTEKNDMLSKIGLKKLN